MFEKLLKSVEDELKESCDDLNSQLILEKTASVLIKIINSEEESSIKSVMSKNDAFIKENRKKWSLGFTKLHALRETCLEAGINFQQQFLKIPRYESDELIGVFMQQHAHACRITGEIIHLLEGGYPDAALARWRTLSEIVVTCLVIQKHGREAAKDFILHGKVQAVEGIQEHRRTAKEMGQETFTDEEIQLYTELKELITNGDAHWHWAKKHTGLQKIGKLREYVGLDKWSHNYKLASRNIHSSYYEMASLYGMRDAKEDMLLCGQSDSGFTDPAHFTAISLAQITSVFLTCYINDKESGLDYKDSFLFINVIKNYVDEVGQAFLAIEKHPD